MLESDIEKVFVRGVKDLGGKAYKFVSPGNDGVPDRLVILNGQVEFVELKQEKGKLSRLQRAQIADLIKMGASVSILYGMRDVQDYLKKKGGDAA